MRGDVVVHERAEAVGELVVRAAQCRECSPSMNTGQFGASPVPGRLMPMLAALTLPGR
jgi:hypothetical protein